VSASPGVHLGEPAQHPVAYYFVARAVRERKNRQHSAMVALAGDYGNKNS
jgi:hypothetical protein